MEALLQEGVEGLVICEPIDLGAIDRRIEVPVLVFGYMPGLTARHIISVLMSGEHNAQEATEYLFAFGHENVHHVAGPVSWYASRERVRGWRRAVRARGATEMPAVHGDWSAASGYEAGRRLARDPGVSAIFAANDDMAIGVIRALMEAGRSVPGDVSVIGFDDVPMAAYVSPSLSTVRYPFETGASRGVAALVQAIERLELPTPSIEDPGGELVIRESTAPPKRDAGRHDASTGGGADST